MTNLPSLPPVTDDDVMAAREDLLRAWSAELDDTRKEDHLRPVLNAYRARLIANGHATEPTAPALVVLPTVDEIAEALGDNNGDEPGTWRREARVVLDLFAARVPHWVKIEPGTVVKAGTRYRTEGDVWAQEKSRDADWTPNGGVWYVDPRTVPAEPEDPALAVVRDWMADAPTADDDDDARELLARIDAARGADA